MTPTHTCPVGSGGRQPPQHPSLHLPDMLFLCMERRKSLFPLSRAVPAFGRSVLAFSCPRLTPARSDNQHTDLPFAEPGLETPQVSSVRWWSVSVASCLVLPGALVSPDFRGI